MMKFDEWVNKTIDDRPITQIYDKARISVDLVKRYRPDLLEGIAVIANLASGAYGVYTHYQIENPQSRAIHFGKTAPSISELPDEMIRRMHPDVNVAEIRQGDVIRVNVRRILHDPQVKSEIEAIMHIAATIVHEATHQKEVKTTGKTSEAGPTKAQEEFMNLLAKPEVQKQIQAEMAKFPKRPQFTM